MDDCTLADFHPGMWVDSHPASDAFASGLRHGTVLKAGRVYVTVEFKTTTGSITRKMAPRNLTPATGTL